MAKRTPQEMSDAEIVRRLGDLSHGGQLMGDPFGSEYHNGWWRHLVTEAANRLDRLTGRSWGVWLDDGDDGGRWQRADGVRPMAWTRLEAIVEAARLSGNGVACEARMLPGDQLSQST